MLAHIIAIRGAHAGKSFALGDRILTFGRTPENAVIVDDGLVSRRHAELRPEAGGAVIHDLGSANGTRVNGERVQSQRLRPGDVVEIGNEAFRFELGPPVQIQAPPMGAVCIRGPLMGQRFPFVNGVLAFGRTPENNVVLASSLASRRHAEVRIEAGGMMLRDLGSSNGTIVNGQRVQSIPVRVGDVVEIGDEAFRLEPPPAPRLPQTIVSDASPARPAAPYRPTALPGVHAVATPAAPAIAPAAYFQPTALPPGVPSAPRAPAVAVPVAPPNAPPPPAGHPALAGLTLTLQCPTCKRSVDARYQDCPWDGTALVNGRTVW